MASSTPEADFHILDFSSFQVLIPDTDDRQENHGGAVLTLQTATHKSYLAVLVAPNVHLSTPFSYKVLVGLTFWPRSSLQI